MEKATKWDANHHHLSPSTAASPSPLMLLMEAELEKARGHISDLEEERRVMTKRLDRFLRKLAEEKAAWKARIRDKARHAVAALKEELSAERAHRRQLEAANGKLMRELAEARSSAKQQAQSYEMERKARELMEDACSELTREVEEDQAEVELLRRECLRMREEMEVERRMLQMAEVWREERVQMKLSDAKLALETKYSQLNHLQAEMEAFLHRTKQDGSSASAMREARIISCDAARRYRGGGHTAAGVSLPSSQQQNEDSVFEHFRRKENHHIDVALAAASPSAASSNSNSNLLQSVSPATDLFLAKIDDDDDAYAAGGSSADMEYDGGRDSFSWFGTSDRSAASLNNGNGGLERRRSVGNGKNTALIRRLWRSAITESRNNNKTTTDTAGKSQANGGGWSPSWDRRRTAADRKREDGGKQKSLREKLMEARMDDHNVQLTCNNLDLEKLS